MTMDVNKVSTSQVVGSAANLSRNYLRLFPGFLWEVLKTSNLFGNFTFLHEAADKPFDVLLNIRLFINVESSFPTHTIKETGKIAVVALI
jgi:hypothetical protein